MIVVGCRCMFLAGMLGVRRVVGMGGVFERVLLGVARVMRGFVMAFRRPRAVVATALERRRPRTLTGASAAA